MSEMPLVLTIPEVAKALRVSRGSAYEAARSGEIPGVVRIGRSLRVPRHALEQMLGESLSTKDEGPTSRQGLVS